MCHSKWREPSLLIILTLFVFLSIAALSIDVLRATYGLKSDEATYVSMALSIAHDADLAFQREDLTRFWHIYSSGPEGIFLKRGQKLNITTDSDFPFVKIERFARQTDDRLYFGKAFIYPLVAAPFIFLGGLNGLLLLNVFLLAGVFCCAYAFASERLTHASALFVASGFIGASIVPLYVIWLMPETLNMSLVFYAYFLWLFKEVRRNPATRHPLLNNKSSDLIAAILLGLVTFSKPSHLPLILPLITLAIWRKEFRHATIVGLVFILVIGTTFGLTGLTSGEFNYQGGDRKTFYGHYPFENGQANFDELGNSMTTNALPSDAGNTSLLGQFLRNAGYFFVGRHFGLMPYFMPGFVMIGWALWRWKTLKVWHLMIAVTVVSTATGLLLLLPNTWSGGGGPVGNRYFLSFYPTLFFLLPQGRASLAGVIIWLTGTLFVAQIFVNPFVSAKQTWQHAEQGLFRILPVELTMVNDLPVQLDQRWHGVPQTRVGIRYGDQPQLILHYLDDNAWRPEAAGIWIAGESRAEIVIRGNPPLSELTITLNSPISNTVTVIVDGNKHRTNMLPNIPVSIRLPVEGVYAAGAQNFMLSIETERGFIPQLRDMRSRDRRHLGVLLNMQGSSKLGKLSQ
jgi:hypothetical protein